MVMFKGGIDGNQSGRSGNLFFVNHRKGKAVLHETTKLPPFGSGFLIIGTNPDTVVATFLFQRDALPIDGKPLFKRFQFRV